MKKRSVLSAVAMLLVSALVLTSATYAWFASSNSASVSAISAQVNNTDGALLLKADYMAVANSMYKTSLGPADFVGLASSLSPVSFSFNGQTSQTITQLMTYYKLAYDGQNFTANGQAGVNTDYQNYSFNVQYKTTATADFPTVYMDYAFTRGTAFTYALITVTNGATKTCYLLGNSDTYNPVIVSLPVTVVDDTGAASGVAIIDSGDTGYDAAYLGSTVTALGNTGTNVSLFTPVATGITEVNVDVKLWAEGQDSDCTGTVTSAIAAMQFAFDLDGTNATGIA